MEAVTVATMLTNEKFFRFLPPEWLHSDQGRQFESKLVKEVCHVLQVEKSRTSPYHPQRDGLVEHYNRTLLDMLATSAKSNLNDWKRYIHAVCYAYNTSVQSSTGFTSHFLMFGREVRLPVDLQSGTSFSESVSPDQYVQQLQHTLNYALQLARDTLREVQQWQKCLYNCSVHGSPFVEGDLVWLHSTVVPADGHCKLHHP